MPVTTLVSVLLYYILKPSMAFKIPFLFFRWADVTEKEEIGKGIIELAKVNSQINCSKFKVPMKRNFVLGFLKYTV